MLVDEFVTRGHKFTVYEKDHWRLIVSEKICVLLYVRKDPDSPKGEWEQLAQRFEGTRQQAEQVARRLDAKGWTPPEPTEAWKRSMRQETPTRRLRSRGRHR